MSLTNSQGVAKILTKLSGENTEVTPDASGGGSGISVNQSIKISMDALNSFMLQSDECWAAKNASYDNPVLYTQAFFMPWSNTTSTSSTHFSNSSILGGNDLAQAASGGYTVASVTYNGVTYQGYTSAAYLVALSGVYGASGVAHLRAGTYTVILMTNQGPISRIIHTNHIYQEASSTSSNYRGGIILYVEKGSAEIVIGFSFIPD